MEGKKKRGCNYTSAEKEILLKIINTFLHIIENKETNAVFITKKKNTWEEITHQYNAVATSGHRTWLQLRHLYENIKQKSKKNVAKENKLQFYEKDEVNTAKKKASEDKREILKTGGGSHKSVLSETDNQILAMVAPQIKPVPNPYDDAALYFGDMETSSSQDVQIVEVHVDKSSIDSIPISSTSSQHINEHEVTIVNDNNINKPNKKTGSKKTVKASSTKEMYFKTKLANARLERKLMINKYKMEHQKLKMEMEILKLRLKNQTKKKPN